MFSPDRFEGNKGGLQPEVQVKEPTEIELREREKELKARYEDPRRKVEAQTLLGERQELREKEASRVEKLKADLAITGKYSAESVEYTKQVHAKSANFHMLEINKLDAIKTEVDEKKKNRNLFQKMKYRFTADPFDEHLGKLEEEVEKHRKEMQESETASKVKEERSTAFIKEKAERTEEIIQEGKSAYSDSKKKLLENTKSINRTSREAIRSTFLSVEEGELDISKLARENNAIVVHAIPLDGWSMRNTSMNNQEVEVDKLSAKEKADILLTKKPDISASILSIDRIEHQDMFYPFGYIVDGKMIASWEGDQGTVADGGGRRRKEEYHGTLQSDTKEQFAKVSQTAATKNFHNAYNESIVHKPSLKGVLIDEQVLTGRKDLGDSVTQYFTPEEEAEVTSRFKDSITATATGVPTSGPYAGKEVFRINRERTAMQKALEYAKEQHPELPVYVRKADGIYTLDGKKVTAEEIYA